MVWSCVVVDVVDDVYILFLDYIMIQVDQVIVQYLHQLMSGLGTMVCLLSYRLNRHIERGNKGGRAGKGAGYISIFVYVCTCLCICIG